MSDGRKKQKQCHSKDVLKVLLGSMCLPGLSEGVLLERIKCFNENSAVPGGSVRPGINRRGNLIYVHVNESYWKKNIHLPQG